SPYTVTYLVVVVLFKDSNVTFLAGCSFPSGQRLPCGRPGTTAAECLRRGCCRDEATFACYYPMDGKLIHTRLCRFQVWGDGVWNTFLREIFQL
uniref:P-type domain-containing protein n=1 Tax=Pygocentrus nattereri TaxID=42514 RepID=A0AAR2J197_PYGNA